MTFKLVVLQHVCSKLSDQIEFIKLYMQHCVELINNKKLFYVTELRGLQCKLYYIETLADSTIKSVGVRWLRQRLSGRYTLHV